MSNARPDKKPALDAFVVAILGIDGSGKSTLSRRLAQEFSADSKSVLISDRAEIFDHEITTDLHAQLTEHLRRRIGQRAKSASSLANYKIPKLAELVLRDRLLGEIVADYQPKFVFMDGMPLCNLTAWAILYRQEDYSASTCQKIIAALARGSDETSPDDEIYRSFPEIRRLRELGFDQLCLPHACVFLDVAPELSLQRIDSRGKAKQVHETAGALAKLREAYQLVCSVLEQRWALPMLVLDGDCELSQLASGAQAFVRKIREERHGQ